MTFRDELRDLLNDCRIDTNVGVSRALDQIIELVDKEYKDARVNMPSNPYQQHELDVAYRTGQDELIELLRQKLKEVEGK